MLCVEQLSQYAGTWQTTLTMMMFFVSLRDEVVNTIQRSMTTRAQQMPNYRLIFQSYNTNGDGRLSRNDFQRLLATNQYNVTNSVSIAR